MSFYDFLLGDISHMHIGPLYKRHGKSKEQLKEICLAAAKERLERCSEDLKNEVFIQEGLKTAAALFEKNYALLKRNEP